MRRYHLHQLIAVVSILFLGAAAGAAEGKIAAILSRIIPPYQQALDGFKQIYPDTQVFTIRQEVSPGQLVDEIKSVKPALILAIGSEALKLSKNMFSNLPVVFTMVLSPGSPGNNISGVALTLPAKPHLEALKLLVPSVKSIGIVYNPEYSAEIIEEFKQVAQKLNIQIVAVAVHSPKEVFSSIMLLAGRVNALWMIMDKDVVPHFNLLQSLSIKERIPLATFSYKYVEMGALLALSPSFESVGKQASDLAKQILGGASPKSLGIVLPGDYYFAINSATAKKIKLEIPQAVLSRKHKLYP